MRRTESDSLDRSHERQRATDSQSETRRQLERAWRGQVADASNALNNRLAAVRSLVKQVDRSRMNRSQVSDLDQIDTEIQHANDIMAELLYGVSGFTPGTVPPTLELLHEGTVRPADILVVEDDVSNREVITRLFQRLGHRVIPARDGLDAFEAMDLTAFDCVICDIRMPGLGGGGLYRQAEERHPQLASRFVFVTGDYGRPDTYEFVTNTGCLVVPKPYEIDELLGAVAKTLQTRNLGPTSQ